MKKITSLLIAAFMCASAANAADNPMFGDKNNQIRLTLGQGFDSGELILFEHFDRPAPYYMIDLSYSQTTTFFTLPARQSINLVKTLGWGKNDYYGRCNYGHCDWGNYGNEIFMLSEDVALLYGERWYFGAGAGAAVQGKTNDRLNTKFLLGFKMFAGYRISENFNMELVMQHFSNGDTGEENNVYDFMGIGVAYNF